MMDIKDIITKASELLEKYSHIPFGNSMIQNLYLMVQDEFTEGRRLRAYLTRLSDRLQAFEENIFNIKEEEIKLKKLQRKLEQETDDLEKELIQVRIQKSTNRLKYLRKLYADCLQEIIVLIHAIEQIPYISREEFERQELEHFKQRLISYTFEPDTLRGLRTIGIELRDENGNIKVYVNEELQKKIERDIVMLKSVTDQIYESFLSFVRLPELDFEKTKGETKEEI